ncbi:hypothetical protein P6166_14590 [Stenotrophomonas sp. HITSZ_GD]|uniref:hypothetical protein n=1 Tax=Stenotrophomonas sp. HITSZ_GD TaxID=3037248 RepID=UPI00240DADF8|nr:hypothetical protein [Stenotrophomonas sp. HITSZ_GD]MDG2526582.1 hypothetical protein [Stenotrophomonas sp. HITSZ_GD]
MSEKGRSFGQLLGAVMANGVRQITMVVRAVTWIGQAIGTAAGWLVVSFGNAWDKVKSVVGAAVDWIMRKVQPVLSVGGAIGSALLGAGRWMLGAGSDVSSAGAVQAIGGAGVPTRPRANLAMPAPVRGRRAPPAPSVARNGGASVVDSSTHTYHITQQPGESAEALAQRIEVERRRRVGVDRRGSLIDTAIAGCQDRGDIAFFFHNVSYQITVRR